MEIWKICVLIIVVSAKLVDGQGPMLQNFFPSSLTTRPNKLEGLSLETLSSQVLEFEGKARTNQIWAPFRCFLLGKAPGVTSKC